VSAGPPRPEYEALARDLRTLAVAFDLRIDEEVERDLVLVVTAFETTDRYVDATQDASKRGELCAAVLCVLHGGGRDERLAGDLSAALAALRSHLLALGVLGGFLESLARFFVRTETLRCTQDGAEYLRCVLDEAHDAAQMTLLAVPAVAVPRFAPFFRVLSEIANLVDKLHDVRGDHARGEIAVRPATHPGAAPSHAPALATRRLGDALPAACRGVGSTGYRVNPDHRGFFLPSKMSRSLPSISGGRSSSSCVSTRCSDAMLRARFFARCALRCRASMA
jgi:hypothetical protein